MDSTGSDGDADAGAGMRPREQHDQGDAAPSATPETLRHAEGLDRRNLSLQSVICSVMSPRAHRESGTAFSACDVASQPR
jgi:hypothetical protein